MPLTRVAAFAIAMVAFFMAMLDTTIVNITLPVMTKSFGVTLETISWVVNGYNLSFGILLITAARLADQFGRKKIFMIGISTFTLASLLCGLAPTAPLLISARILQGLAAALLVPVTLPLVLDLFPASKQGVTIGIWAAMAGMAAASGPALGGLIIEYAAWRWIFFINIPIGIICLTGTALLFKESFDETASKKIDWWGMVALICTTFCATYALIQGNDWGWRSIQTISLLGTAAIGLVVFVIVEKRSSAPMIPLSLLTILPFSAGSITLFLIGMALMDGVFFLSFFMTAILGMSSLKAGLMLTALPLSSTFFSAFAGPFSTRYGSRLITTAGMCVMAAAVYSLGFLSLQSSDNAIIKHLVFFGAGLGLSLAPVINACIRAVPHDKIGMASGIGNMARTIGTVFGAALIVALFTRSVNHAAIPARVEAIQLIESSVVLKPQARRTIIDHLNAARFSSAGSIPTIESIYRVLDQKKTTALAAAPDYARGAIETLFARQRAEVDRLYPQVITIIKKHIVGAFKSTFHLNSYFLLLGIISAFFCEPFKKTKKPVAQ